MKVMIAVTHLLGTGHLVRALMLARAFEAAGHVCTIVSGGMPAKHLATQDLTFVQLPPLRSDGVNFTKLLDAQGSVVDPDYMDTRAEKLKDVLRQTQPDVLITELFPFGRRVLSAEYLQLLRCASLMQPAPLICASIRDILAPPSKPAKASMTEEIIETHYDVVLVHSDPAVTPLDISWPVTERLASYLKYTGFVAPSPPAPLAGQPKSNDVLVSAGGGDVGAGLFATALDSARLDPTRRWHLLVGGAHAHDRIAEMQRCAPANVLVEPARPDFRQLLQTAGASVSMAGYNTALDVLQTGVPAVFIPFDAGSEVEQSLRAKALAELPGISVLANAQLSGSALLAHVDKVIAAPCRPASTQGTDGASNTVKIVEALRSNRQ